MTFILAANDPADASVMGGKAAALARLDSANLPIPPWFVVTPQAFDLSLTQAQRNQICSSTDATQLREILPGLMPSQQVTQAVMHQLNTAFPGQNCFAVRSSAVDEDGSRHSFAGQLESYLFVPADRVIDRIADVWRSGFADRVFAYRLERGMDQIPLAPAVLVQQMIDAEVSGVAFACDPIGGSRSTVVISSVFGLGTALVGGDADSDTYRVRRTGEIEQKIASKTVRHVADASSVQGVRAEAVDEQSANRSTLEPNQVRDIANLVLDVSKLQGRPQDIEWAMCSGKLYLLQARPITSLANVADPDGVRAIWDNSNIAESYSGITTPLTFSFARLAYEGVYREFCRIMKVPARVIADNDAMFSQMLGMIRGRVYYNLLNWYRLLTMLPGFSVNQKFMEQMMGVSEGLPAEIADSLVGKTWSQRQADRLRLAWSAISLFCNHLILKRKIAAFHQRLNGALAMPNPPLEQMRIDQLSAEFRMLQSRLLTRWDAPLINDFLAMIFFGTLGKLTRRWCGDTSGTLQNDLISDEGGIISTEPARRIMEMGTLASADAGLVDALCNSPVEQAKNAIAGNAALLGGYQSYLEKFGDRCLEELKLESATLVDDPTPLIRSIGQMARRVTESPPDPAPQAKPRQAAEQHIRNSLRWHLPRRLLFWWVLRNARGRVRDRENLRFERTRLFGRVRRIFVEMGRRFYAEGLLNDARDIFYLTLDEILSFVEGTIVADDIKSPARMRRSAFTGYRALPTPADRFETRGAVYLGNRFEAKAAASNASDGSHLAGTGCCPGIVRGPVRIILDPRGAQLKRGEILVALRTDPGWIMLFPAATGILVERGSLLSHSAIVAREMNIPAIVSIPNLTRSLTDGQWVQMNGSTGVIERIAAPSGSSASAQAVAV